MATAMNWNTFDLNLLIIFDTVMQERNLTRAGQRLGLSQSAVSHSLARLRNMLQDELFIRTPEGMLPTPRAERMFAPIHEALQEMRVTLEADAFDPAQASLTFTISANNYAARAVVPALIRRVAALAPSVLIEVRPIGMLDSFDQLDAGNIELVLSSLSEGGERFKCLGLLQDDYVAILSQDHQAAQQPELSVEQLGSLPHIAVTSSGDDTQFVDEALAEHGLERHVWARVPLLSLLSVLAGSRALAIVPRRVAEDFATFYPLAIRKLPFASARVALSMIWHRRLDHHPAHRWLRTVLRQSVKQEDAAANGTAAQA